LADAARISAKSLEEKSGAPVAGKKGGRRRSPLSPDVKKRKLRAEIGTSLLVAKSASADVLHRWGTVLSGS